MPWKVQGAMSQREEFMSLASVEGANVADLCRRFGISRTTGYKWLKRFAREGRAGLTERSRRPHSSPVHTAAQVERMVLGLRDSHRAWGGRKLRARLQALGYEQVPAASTITAILRRRGRLDAEESAKHKAFTRFEHERPNALWQMDFKGHFALEQGRCHALTVLDDHSRFALGLRALDNERGVSVQAELTALFRRYGLPERMLMDNGSPWGDDGTHPYTPLTVWLMRLGVAVSHGRPYHPQTQGKDERFHRTLSAEVLRWERFRDLVHCQRRFDAWRSVYNHQRPHEALAMAVPAARYMASRMAFPETLPAIDYAPGLELRKVQDQGWITYKGRDLRVPKALKGLPVAIRPVATDATFEVLFCNHPLGRFSLRDDTPTLTVNHVSEHL